jgi:hypothetical protein
MNYLFARSQIWLVLFGVLFSCGGWVYMQRVLIAHQVSDAAAHGRPRGNLSDLYPRWIGARELLLHGRNPYREEVTREIQAGYYGRPIDPSRPNDPHDKVGFAYPVYIAFFLAPTVGLPFPIVQKSFFWLLLVLTGASTILWFRVLRWSLPPWTQVSLLALMLSSIAVIQGLLLQQISLLVAGMMTAAIALIIVDQQVAAGILLAVATIKPQLVLLLLTWLLIWTLGDWRHRYRWVVSYALSMTILCGLGEWYLPHWISLFWRAVRDYQNYTGAASVLDSLTGTPWSWIFEIAAFIALLAACWKERRNSADTGSFAFTVSMVLATTVLLVPISAQYNQVLLIPAMLLLIKERRTIWRTSLTNRILMVMATALIAWQWIASSALALLSYVLRPETLDRVWAAPIWTTLQTPVAVTALMLFHYYQTTFDTPAASTRRRMLGNQRPAQEP